jgi:regulator of sigma E protease
MDLGSLFQSALSNFWFYIPAWLIMISVIVAVHEYGHFIVARWCGVDVKIFSVGFGRELIGFTDKLGTRWQISAIPLGGYVMYADDADPTSFTANKEPGADGKPAELPPGAYHGRPVWQRAAIAVAGPMANFILATLIFAALFTIYGERTAPVRIAGFAEPFAGEKAGLKIGDRIVAIDGEIIDEASEMQQIVATSSGRVLGFAVERSGTMLDIAVTPAVFEDTDLLGYRSQLGRIGVQLKSLETEMTTRYHGPLGALWLGAKKTQFIIGASARGIWDLIRGRIAVTSLAGPTKMVEVAGKVASLGIPEFIQLIAIISVGIGFFNLLPIPPLDGGHLLFYGIEAIRGRPIPERTQEFAFRVGLTLVLMLVLVTTTVHLWQLVGRTGLFG